MACGAALSAGEGRGEAQEEQGRVKELGDPALAALGAPGLWGPFPWPFGIPGSPLSRDISQTYFEPTFRREVSQKRYLPIFRMHVLFGPWALFLVFHAQT